MRRDVARHRSYSDHYGAMANCALCQSPSALKLIDSVFICEWCLWDRDSVSFSSPGRTVKTGRTVCSRPVQGSLFEITSLLFTRDKVSGSDPSDVGADE